MQAADRLIVALDVPTIQEAAALVGMLDNVSFFKVGWQLFMTGQVPELLERLRGKHLFLDLKIPGDIGNTIASVVSQAVALNVHFMTLSASVPKAAIDAARRARGQSAAPKLLVVPVLSSMDASDLESTPGADAGGVDDYIAARGGEALDAGCDGLIVSGHALSVCRRKFPAAILVSPGIRPSGSATDDHKRHTTPAEAIRFGADYLVVGRPITTARNPRDAAQQVIVEIEEAANAIRRSASLA
jgi:orotidine-5'-phosphate decarboxylase